MRLVSGANKQDAYPGNFLRLLRPCANAKRKEYSAKSKDSDFVLHVFTALSTRRSSLALFSLDHLIRSYQHVGWDRQADLLRRYQVNHELELRGLLHRLQQICETSTINLVAANSRPLVSKVLKPSLLFPSDPGVHLAFQQVQRERSVFEQLVMKSTDVELGAESFLCLRANGRNFELPDLIRQRPTRTAEVAVDVDQCQLTRGFRRKTKCPLNGPALVMYSNIKN